jgi:hypothetical protein
MKKFLLHSLLFLIVLSPVPFLLDAVLTKSLRNSKRYNYGEWNDLFKGNVNSDVVIYGSSRAYRHFDTKVLEEKLQLPVYNLGVDGYQFHMQYARHLVYFKHNPPPKTILLSLDYWTLGKTNELFMYEQFLPYMNDSVIRVYTKAYKGFNYWDYHLPFVRYFGNIKEIVHGVDISINPDHNYAVKYKGFKGNDEKWQVNFQQAAEALRANKTINAGQGKTLDFTTDSLTLHLFELFLNEMKLKKIKVIFVISPIYKDARSMVSHQSFVLKFQNYAARYHFPFLDYSADSISMNRDFFYNATHLNKTGAALFSEKLAADIKTYLNH